MSRWSLLGAALKGKRETTSEYLSVHSFTGLGHLLRAQKTIWKGGFEFDFVVDAKVPAEAAVARLTVAADDFFSAIDCAECTINLLLCCGSDILDHYGHLRENLIPILPERSFRLQSLLLPDEIAQSSSPQFCTAARLMAFHTTFVPFLRRADYIKYTLPNQPSSSSPAQIVFTRERPKNVGVDSRGLLSNFLHDGIDNTGNVRVWDAEQIMLLQIIHLAIGDGERNQTIVLDGKRVLELGGGMTGLCGLGVALCSPNVASVIVTDGHPDCVKNQNVCIQMNRSSELRLGRKLDSVSSHLLRWSKGDKYGDLTRILQENSGARFDVIIAADCLFFRDFHEDLLWTLDNALTETPSGIIYLLQPRRGDSMETFLAMASSSTFDVVVSEDFPTEVTSALSAATRDTAAGFNPDIHQPLIAKLTRKQH